MLLTRLSRFLILFGALITPDNAHSQVFLDSREARDFETHDAQIALAIPAFNDTTTIGGYDIYATAILRYAIRNEFRNWPEKIQANGQPERVHVGSGLTYLIPRPLMKPDHVFASHLSRTTLMQGSVWGNLRPYTLPNSLDGWEVEVFFTYAGEYQDYRSDKLEEWKISDEAVKLSVGIPRSTVTLPSYFIEPESYETIKNNGICFRHPITGQCNYFTALEKTQLRGIDQRTGEITITRFGDNQTRYTARMPEAFFAPSATIGYVAMFVAYARGNWSEVEKHANQLLENADTSTEMRVDTLLYKGAARFRRGEDGLAALREAHAISPRSRVVARYLIMGYYLHATVGTSDGEGFLEELQSLAPFAGEDWIIESGFGDNR